MQEVCTSFKKSKVNVAFDHQTVDHCLLYSQYLRLYSELEMHEKGVEAHKDSDFNLSS